MATLAAAMPIPAGGGDDFKAFALEVSGGHAADHARSRKSVGITRERVWIQGTPDGEVCILMLEGKDPVSANLAHAASKDPYDVWFKQRAGAILGANFDEPIPVRPELVYQSAPVEGADGKESVAVAIPLLPGQTEAYLQMVAEVNGPRRGAHDEFHRKAGVTEDWYLQRTPRGDIVILYLVADDLARAMQTLAASTDEHEQWFKERLRGTEGIDWGGPPPPLPELALDWRAG